MNEYVDRSMGFDWVRSSCVNRTEEPKETEPEFSAPRIETENANSEISKKMVKDIDNYFITTINPLRAKLVESRHKHDEFWKTLNYQERMDFRNKIFKMVQNFYDL